MSAVLLLHGEAGSGKTALLDHLQAQAEDFEVVRLDAVDNETELGFAALHELLRGQLDRLDTLPEPHADALRGAFGLARTSPPDRFLVALATLELLSHNPGRQPLLVVVDDGQWLDHETSDVLGFVGRRLHADAVALVVAVRDSLTSTHRFRGLPDLDVRGLPVDAARMLVQQARSTTVPDRVMSGLMTGTGGNPLALLEAASELTIDQLAGTEPLPDPIPSGSALEPLYAAARRSMPPRTQLMLLAAAADGSGRPRLLWRAGVRLGFSPDDALPAEDRRLIAIRDVVRFRHPLIRSAIYYAAPLVTRQRVHLALADASGDLGDLDRRIRHLAAAAAAPDDSVADELEGAASDAMTRGSWENAAWLLQRSAELSVHAPVITARFLAAAEAACTAGLVGRAQALLNEAAADHGDRRYQGQVHRVEARVHRLRRQPAQATSALLAAARQLATIDARAARDILLEASVQAQISDGWHRRGRRVSTWPRSHA